MGRAYSTNEEEERIQDTGGRAQKKRTTTKTRRRWVDNIKIDLGETGWGGIEWTDLAQDRDLWRALVNTVMNLRVP
jgi:DNA topoisomerase IB